MPVVPTREAVTKNNQTVFLVAGSAGDTAVMCGAQGNQAPNKSHET
jgi:hypothetical protein